MPEDPVIEFRSVDEARRFLDTGYDPGEVMHFLNLEEGEGFENGVRRISLEDLERWGKENEEIMDDFGLFCIGLGELKVGKSFVYNGKRFSLSRSGEGYVLENGRDWYVLSYKGLLQDKDRMKGIYDRAFGGG